MMDCVVPGGVAADIAAGGAEALVRALGEIAARLPEIRRQHDGTAPGRPAMRPRSNRRRRVRCGVGGVAGRAAGRGFDSRSALMPAYSRLPPAPATQTAGDSAARQAVRHRRNRGQPAPDWQRPR